MFASSLGGGRTEPAARCFSSSTSRHRREHGRGDPARLSTTAGARFARRRGCQRHPRGVALVSSNLAGSGHALLVCGPPRGGRKVPASDGRSARAGTLTRERRVPRARQLLPVGRPAAVGRLQFRPAASRRGGRRPGAHRARVMALFRSRRVSRHEYRILTATGRRRWPHRAIQRTEEAGTRPAQLHGGHRSLAGAYSAAPPLPASVRRPRCPENFYFRTACRTALGRQTPTAGLRGDQLTRPPDAPAARTDLPSNTSIVGDWMGPSRLTRDTPRSSRGRPRRYHGTSG